MTAKKFRKKPVEIEAVHFQDLGAAGLNQQKAYEVASWIAGHDDDESDDFPEYASNAIWIETLEGTMIANLGDWIIRGVQGEFYPCKPDIFDATYEAVDQ